MITVKLAQLPGALREYVLEDGSTVQAVLDIAGTTQDGFGITVNGNEATSSAVLANGDNVILSNSAKGNG